jgi:hypothetical protein
VCLMELYCALGELQCALGDFFALRCYALHWVTYFVRYGVIL